MQKVNAVIMVIILASLTLTAIWFGSGMLTPARDNMAMQAELEPHSRNAIGEANDEDDDSKPREIITLHCESTRNISGDIGIVFILDYDERLYSTIPLEGDIGILRTVDNLGEEWFTLNIARGQNELRANSLQQGVKIKRITNGQLVLQTSGNDWIINRLTGEWLYDRSPPTLEGNCKPITRAYAQQLILSQIDRKNQLLAERKENQLF